MEGKSYLVDDGAVEAVGGELQDALLVQRLGRGVRVPARGQLGRQVRGGLEAAGLHRRYEHGWHSGGLGFGGVPKTAGEVVINKGATMRVNLK